MNAPTPRVSLREITSANRTAVEAAKVTAVQADYVTGVAESLIAAAFYEKGDVRAPTREPSRDRQAQEPDTK